MGLRSYLQRRKEMRALLKHERRLTKSMDALRLALKPLKSKNDKLDVLAKSLVDLCTEDDCEHYAKQFGRRAHAMHRMAIKRSRAGLDADTQSHSQSQSEQSLFYHDIQYHE